MRAALVTALCLATAAAWSRLELALQNYPRVHDRNLRAFERGDPAARIVRAKVKNGLGNREQALLSGFALALAANAALVVEWLGGRLERQRETRGTCRWPTFCRFRQTR